MGVAWGGYTGGFPMEIFAPLITPSKALQWSSQCDGLHICRHALHKDTPELSYVSAGPEKVRKLSILNAQCMVYLPRFGQFFMVDVGKYTVH